MDMTVATEWKSRLCRLGRDYPNPRSALTMSVGLSVRPSDILQSWVTRPERSRPEGPLGLDYIALDVLHCTSHYSIWVLLVVYQTKDRLASCRELAAWQSNYDTAAQALFSRNTVTDTA